MSTAPDWKKKKKKNIYTFLKFNKKWIRLIFKIIWKSLPSRRQAGQGNRIQSAAASWNRNGGRANRALRLVAPEIVVAGGSHPDASGSLGGGTASPVAGRGQGRGRGLSDVAGVLGQDSIDLAN